ncbi:dTMP kinase [Bacteroidota bacterium]
MKFVVIEGLDGSGKSTQIKLLRNYLEKNNISYKYLHFPRTNSPVYGEMVAKFLRGDLGKIDEVDPYLVALLYAGDRENAKKTILDWLNNYLVLVDRYVYSNMAFQCAKIDDLTEKNKLRNWIRYMEFKYFNIPIPDLNLFLDVPFEFTKHKLSKNREGNDREYLNGKTDIHEESLDFQEKVRQEYLHLAQNEPNYKIIDCKKSETEILDPQEILNRIVGECRQNNIF